MIWSHQNVSQTLTFRRYQSTYQVKRLMNREAFLVASRRAWWFIAQWVGLCVPTFRIPLADDPTWIKEQLEAMTERPVSVLSVERQSFEEWCHAIARPSWLYRTVYRQHVRAKMLEHYLSFLLLTLKRTDVYLDVASGISDFSNIVRQFVGCSSWRQDLSYRAGVHADFIGSSAELIPLPDGSVTKMTLHNSFEQFEGEADRLFVREAARLLAPGGHCVIVPLFIREEFVNVTDPLLARGVVFDHGAKVQLATGFESRFGRYYDVKAFRKRVYAYARDLDLSIFYVPNAKQIAEESQVQFIAVLTKRSP